MDVESAKERGKIGRSNKRKIKKKRIFRKRGWSTGQMLPNSRRMKIEKRLLELVFKISFNFAEGSFSCVINLEARLQRIKKKVRGAEVKAPSTDSSRKDLETK